MTQQEIAEALNVSVGTVSLALQNSPLLKKETVARIKKIARLTNYRPNLAARTLQTGKTFSVGIIGPKLYNPFWAETAAQITGIFSRKNYMSIVLFTSNTEEFREEIEKLLARRVDGLVILTEEVEVEELVRTQDKGVPVVFNGHPKICADYVSCDVYKGGCMATTHLINLGHKKIGFVGVLREKEERYQGYKDTLLQYRLPFEKKWSVPGNTMISSGYEGMKKILSAKEMPTAVFAFNDFIAIGAMRAIHEKGLDIPKDIAIIGFDDISEAKYLKPSLTTVYFPKEEPCKKMAELLLKKMDKKNPVTSAPEIILFEPKIAIRESCGYCLKQQDVSAKVP